MLYLLVLRAVWILLVVPGIAVADDDPLHFGPRAVSLGGAFTAVADDATAFYWNPAGYAFGPFVQAGAHWAQSEHDRAYGFSVGYTFMGIAGTSIRRRASLKEPDVAVDTFDLTFSILQSLPIDNLVVAANAHYLRGSIANEDTSSKVDFDAAFLYEPSEWIRLGVMARSLLEPSFRNSQGDELALSRHFRAGVALSLPRRTLVAVDFDLSRRAHGREMSFGLEKKFLNSKVAVRTGVKGNWGAGGDGHAAWSLGLGGRIRWLLLDLAYRARSEHRDDRWWFGATVSP